MHNYMYCTVLECCFRQSDKAQALIVFGLLKLKDSAETGLLIHVGHGKKSQILQDFQGQICKTPPDFRGILREFMRQTSLKNNL